MDNEDLIDDFNEDFISGDEEEETEEVEETFTASNGQFSTNRENSYNGDDFAAAIDNYRPYALSNGIPVNGKDACVIFRWIDKIDELLNDGESGEVTILLIKTQVVVQEEYNLLYRIVKKIYSHKYPELETLVPSALEYVFVVRVLEECGTKGLQKLEGVLTKEQVMIVSISAQTNFKPNALVDSSLLASAMNGLEQLLTLQDRIKAYVTERVETIAPNVSQLLGPATAALLLSAVGGVGELSETPSCNLASLGKPKYRSHEFNVDESNVRQKGYIYLSPLVQNTAIDFQKQALRMACAKCSLAARVDASHSAPTSNLGAKWRFEIESKLRKLQEPANISNVKPLPVPEDKPKKKRAGRRFRKYKQQFQLSHLRQLQNRMEFNKQEHSVLDAFGEEIGMGMANTLQAPSTAVIRATKGVTKLRKPMQHRLANQSRSLNDFFASDPRASPLNPDDNITQKDVRNNTKNTAEMQRSNEWFLKYIQRDSKDL
ncbi:LAMI_0E01816g1_1 [Lachancea mirantina]|uniref:LAMI_0E01816g1_1 n=1 Tax=Lachancea mirantina TaxID=1230905 RepID=A0A1G4JIS8_9SACH|nr:LAMI_0E01816g1_1 [Lachancea mirantina]